MIPDIALLSKAVGQKLVALFDLVPMKQKRIWNRFRAIEKQLGADPSGGSIYHFTRPVPFKSNDSAAS